MVPNKVHQPSFGSVRTQKLVEILKWHFLRIKKMYFSKFCNIYGALIKLQLKIWFVNAAFNIPIFREKRKLNLFWTEIEGYSLDRIKMIEWIFGHLDSVKWTSLQKLLQSINFAFWEKKSLFQLHHFLKWLVQFCK